MSVVRQKRRTTFTIVDNASVNDTRLSLRAKGLHLVLLSKPDHWDFSSERLATECVEGRDAIRAAMRELKEAGYVREIREQGAAGKWSTVIEVSELPNGDIPVSPAGRVGVTVRPKTGFQSSGNRVIGEPSFGDSGDKSNNGEARTESNDYPMQRAARVEVKRSPRPARRLRAVADPDEALASNRMPDDSPAPESSAGRGPTIAGLAKDFARSCRTRYPLGDTRRVSNDVALRANISRWHKKDGIPLAEIAAAMETFFDGNHVKDDGEPWRRFINLFARMHSKATAPDITDPAYYTDQQPKENIEWTVDSWLAAQEQ